MTVCGVSGAVRCWWPGSLPGSCLLWWSCCDCSVFSGRSSRTKPPGTFSSSSVSTCPSPSWSYRTESGVTGELTVLASAAVCLFCSGCATYVLAWRSCVRVCVCVCVCVCSRALPVIYINRCVLLIRGKSTQLFYCSKSINATSTNTL